jgi:hypothetical protein
MSTDLKITTEMLYQGALIFALLDAICVPLLAWRVGRETFHRLGGSLPLAASLVWYGIWVWAIGNFWGTVYSYVFPAWARTWVPWIAFLAAGTVTYGLWTLALRLRWQPVITYCLIGGTFGSLTHIWAVYRGVVSRPPMLLGASPLGAVVIAFFEYMFYWCIILVLAVALNWTWIRLGAGRHPKTV